MNGIIRRAIVAMAMTLAMLGGLGFAAAHTAPGLPSMTPPGTPMLSDDVHAGPIRRLSEPTPSPRVGYP